MFAPPLYSTTFSHHTIYLLQKAAVVAVGGFGLIAATCGFSGAIWTAWIAVGILLGAVAWAVWRKMRVRSVRPESDVADESRRKIFTTIADRASSIVNAAKSAEPQSMPAEAEVKSEPAPAAVAPQETRAGPEEPERHPDPALVGEESPSFKVGDASALRPQNDGTTSAGLTDIELLINEILAVDLAGIRNRTREEWQRLHRAFFTRFAPGSNAAPEERRAWDIALAAINNTRCPKPGTPPMQHDGFALQVSDLKNDFDAELKQNDFSYQPRKCLLLMAAMVGRVLAGRKAERAEVAPATILEEFLQDENRSSDHLGSVFVHIPQLTIFDYLNVGLMPVRWDTSKQIISSANGLRSVERVSLEGGSPYLRLNFNRPVSDPLTGRQFPSVGVTVLKPARENKGAVGLTADDIESDLAVLDACIFTETDQADVKQLRTAHLLQLGLTQRFLFMIYQANRAGTSRLAQALGRTPQERSVIEKFFALGFMTGGGNERWPRQERGWPFDADDEKAGVGMSSAKAAELAKEAEKIRDLTAFFGRFSIPEAATAKGARARKEIFERGKQVKANFLKLSATAFFAPLLKVFVMPDGKGGWIVPERQVNDLVKQVDGPLAPVLEGAGPVIEAAAQRFKEDKHARIFRYVIADALADALFETTRQPYSLAIRRELLAGFGVAASDVPELAIKLDLTKPMDLASVLETTRRELVRILEPQGEEPAPVAQAQGIARQAEPVSGAYLVEVEVQAPKEATVSEDRAKAEAFRKDLHALGVRALRSLESIETLNAKVEEFKAQVRAQDALEEKERTKLLAFIEQTATSCRRDLERRAKKAQAKAREQQEASRHSSPNSRQSRLLENSGRRPVKGTVSRP